MDFSIGYTGTSQSEAYSFAYIPYLLNESPFYQAYNAYNLLLINIDIDAEAHHIKELVLLFISLFCSSFRCV
jgi:hypothetical protein